MTKGGVVLDEDIPRYIEKLLNRRGIDTYRFRKGASDLELIEYAVEKGCPILTRDKDFRRDDLPDHPGVITDSYLHNRNPSEVVDAILHVIIELEPEKIENHVWYVSNYLE